MSIWTVLKKFFEDKLPDRPKMNISVKKTI